MDAEIWGRNALLRTFRSLRHRNFRLFFAGQMVSLIGTWLQSVAQQWLVYRLTGSALLLGAVGFAGQIPVFFLSPAGGAVADRVDRRKILLATQTCMMLLALGLGTVTLCGVVTVPLVFAFAILLGCVNGFDVPGRQSFVVEMASREDLPNAIALNSSIVNGARILGPALAGVLVAAVGEGWCFVLNGLSFVAVIAGLWAMRIVPRNRESTGRSPLRDIWEGFRFVARTGPIRSLLLLMASTSLLCIPYLVLMPVFARKCFDADARGLGELMAASGSGALAAALLLALRGSARGLGSWVAGAAGGFGVALILFGTVAQTGHLWLGLLCLPPVGFCMVLEMSACNTLLQTLAPDALRGRVMSAWAMTFFGMAPIGAVTEGFLADRFGAPTTVRIGGAVAVAAAAIFAVGLGSFREEARALIRSNELQRVQP